jgi:hypothetical protein
MASLSRAARHRMVEQLDLAGVRPDEPEAELERSGLAGPVGPEEPEAFSGNDGEVDAAHHLQRAERLAQATRAERRHFQLARTMARRTWSLRWKK